jgi:hypothetical protein
MGDSGLRSFSSPGQGGGEAAWTDSPFYGIEAPPSRGTSSSLPSKHRARGRGQSLLPRGPRASVLSAVVRRDWRVHGFQDGSTGEAIRSGISSTSVLSRNRTSVGWRDVQGEQSSSQAIKIGRSV